MMTSPSTAVSRLDRSRTPRACVALIAAVFLGFIGAETGFAETELEARLRNRLESAFVAESLKVMDDRLHAQQALRRVYPERAYQPIWVTEDGLTERGDRLARWLESEPRKHGLRPADYHLDVVDALDESQRLPVLVDLELALSDAFLMVGSHFLAGRLNPETLDSEWHANRRHRDLGPVLHDAATQEDPGSVLTALLPQADGYLALVERLALLRERRNSGGWPAIAVGATLREGDAGERVAELVARLAAGGDYSGPISESFDEEVAAAVRVFQARHGLKADGLAGRATLAALNVDINTRIDQIIVNLERWRWLPESLGNRYILVNIAGFYLEVFEEGRETLSMRVVVGRPYRRTPVFSGTITYLVLNPFWEVPSSIAARDKLPLIKADPNYLSHQGYTLLEGWGADERVVDPSTVDWTQITARNFRYRLRQSPGPFNALGQVKFMFPNAFSVYLHDSPARELFAEEQRSFSSGCIRLEQPVNLAELLLNDDPNWGRRAIDASLMAGKEQVVRLRRPIPVHLQYWTTWVDADGVVQFREDIYGRDRPVRDELREAPPT